MYDYSALVERLLAWSETPYEGDPMVDALLCDVPAAGRAIQALMSKVEVGKEALMGILPSYLELAGAPSYAVEDMKIGDPAAATACIVALQKMEE